MSEYKELMAQAWAATGQMRYRDIANGVGLPTATVHRFLTGSTSYDRRRVLRLLLWIYGPQQPDIIAAAMSAHDRAREKRIETMRRNFRINA